MIVISAGGRMNPSRSRMNLWWRAAVPSRSSSFVPFGVYPTFRLTAADAGLSAYAPLVIWCASSSSKNSAQIAWRIKVPIIAPALVMTGLFSMIATLQVFAEPTTLKPLTNALSSTWSPLMFVYRDAFTRADINGAAATSIIIAVATFALSFLFLRVVQRRAFGQED